MSDTLEGTTMEYIARLLHDEIDADVEWEQASDYTRAHYRKLAVRIINTAEPVWRKRVEDNYYEYLVIPSTVPKDRWPSLAATHIPLDSRREAEKSVKWARDEYGLSTIILRRRRGSEWELS